MKNVSKTVHREGNSHRHQTCEADSPHTTSCLYTVKLQRADDRMGSLSDHRLKKALIKRIRISGIGTGSTHDITAEYQKGETFSV